MLANTAGQAGLSAYFDVQGIGHILDHIANGMADIDGCSPLPRMLSQ